MSEPREHHVTIHLAAVLSAGSALLEAMRRSPQLGASSIEDSASQPLAVAQTYARLVHEIDGPDVLLVSAQILARADDELRELRTRLDQADEITELAASYTSAAIHVQRIGFEARTKGLSPSAERPLAPAPELVLRRLVAPAYVDALAPSISRTSLDQTMYCLGRVNALVTETS